MHDPEFSRRSTETSSEPADVEATPAPRQRAFADDALRRQYDQFPLPALTWRATDDGDLELVDYNDAAYEFTAGNVAEQLGIRASGYYASSPAALEGFAQCSGESPHTAELDYFLQSRGEHRRLRVTYARVTPGLTNVYINDRTESSVAPVGQESRRLREVLDAMYPFVGVFDRGGNVLEINRPPLIAASLERSDVIGKPLWETYWWNYSPESVAEVRDALESVAAGETIRGDFRIRVADDNFILVHGCFSPLLSGAGEVEQIVGSAVDVSEQRRSEGRLRSSLEEKRLLIRELHHRVKNNLQVVSSLLHMQSRRTADEATRQGLLESEGRIATLALIHESLERASSPTDRVSRELDFVAYVRKLLRSICELFPFEGEVAVTTDRQPVLVGLDQALPCGLIVHELLTNAVKHAYKEGEAGPVRIEIHSDQGDISLSVADEGVGMPESRPDGNTLGMKLVQILANQLQGTLTVENTTSDRGTTVRLSFPIRAPGITGRTGDGAGAARSTAESPQ